MRTVNTLKWVNNEAFEGVKNNKALTVVQVVGEVRVDDNGLGRGELGVVLDFGVNWDLRSN